MMRLIHLVLFNLLVILGLLVWIAFAPVSPIATGGPHPGIGGMSIGGDGLARSSEIAVVAYLLQAAVLVLVLLLIASSVRKSRRTLLFWGPLLAVAALYQVVWWNIWRGHQHYLLTGETGFFLGFATPTAWMVIGVWSAGLGLLLIYVLGFRQFIFSADDEATYQRLLETSDQPRSDIAGDH